MDIETSLISEELLNIARDNLTDPFKIELDSIARRERGRLGWCIPEEDLYLLTVEEIGEMMPRFIDGDAHYFMPPFYWENFRHEFQDFLCTDSAKYADVRKSLTLSGNKSQTAIVSMISAAVAAHIGLAAGALVPFCALCLLAVVRMGKNAFCQGEALKVKLGGEQPKRRR